MTTPTKHTTANKWFEVLTTNQNGEEESHWVLKDDLEFNFSEACYKRFAKFRNPTTPETVVSINSINEMKPGDTDLVNFNMTALRDLVDTLMEDCEMDRIVRISEIDETELWKIHGLLDLITYSAKSIKDEIEKQQDYLEASGRKINKSEEESL